jgi:hypothetical protein
VKMDWLEAGAAKPPSSDSSTTKIISFMLCWPNASSHCRSFRDS